MHETLMLHSVMTGVFAALVVAVVFLIRSIVVRRSKKIQGQVLDQATDQMRETGILISLVRANSPEEVARLQQQLQLRGLYHGTPDGVLDTETIRSLRTLAEAKQIDIDSEVQSLLSASETAPPCPESQREERAVQTALERLAESNAPSIYYRDRRDRIA